jgi:hypothetical protein
MLNIRNCKSLLRFLSALSEVLENRHTNQDDSAPQPKQDSLGWTKVAAALLGGSALVGTGLVGGGYMAYIALSSFKPIEVRHIHEVRGNPNDFSQPASIPPAITQPVPQR